MIIDGKSTILKETQVVNRAIDAAWGNPHAIFTECPNVFLELTDGPDCVEVVIGGDTWNVHDRFGKTPVFLEKCICDEGGFIIRKVITDVADFALYRAAKQFSPLEKIDWHEERRELIVTALKCAAAESDEHGYPEQANAFRRVYEEIES